MSEEALIILSRGIFLILLSAMIFISRLRNRNISNIPFYAGCSLIFFYVCYIFSGITFGNGVSLLAEFLFVLLVVVLDIGFLIGRKISKISLLGDIARRNWKLSNIMPVNKGFVIISVVVFIFYLFILTNGNPLLLFVAGTQLKLYRLTLLLGDKDFFLFFLESIVISMLIIGIVWSIIGHKDDRNSDLNLLIFLTLVFLQVVSTGSRSPLISFFLLFVLALYEGRKYSRTVSKILLLIKRYSLVVIVFAIIYMSWTTSLRIDSEDLDISVFLSYFDIVDIGYLEFLFQEKSDVLFMLGTFVVYLADTFNNLVLRVQLAPTIVHSFGYLFVFPYVSFLEPLTRDYTDFFSTWRDISSQNNAILLRAADSATQWSTVFGDFVWDFGIYGAFPVVFLFFMLLGYVIESTNKSNSTLSVILKIYLVSCLILPLVNPFSSLQFHIVCIILFLSKFLKFHSIKKMWLKF